MDNDIVRLNVVGITHRQIETGVYALVLEEAEGDRRLPILVGYSEAQSIESCLKKQDLPRPNTHDSITAMMHAFGISLRSILIKRNSEGHFTADLDLSGCDQEHTLDVRSSDAIALAIRMNAPIYAERTLLTEAGMSNPENPSADDRKKDISAIPPNPLKRMSVAALQRLMERAVSQENYEKAARIKDELSRREKQ